MIASAIIHNQQNKNANETEIVSSLTSTLLNNHTIMSSTSFDDSNNDNTDNDTNYSNSVNLSL